MLSVIWTVVSLLLAFSVTCNSQVYCGLSNPSGNANCRSTTRGTWCCTCWSGYRFNSYWKCEDINECDEGRCGLRLCQNSVGSFTCLYQCVTGYRWDGFGCEDRNECYGVSPCSHNADCVNTVGSYRCSCKSGFKGNGIVCTDIDECDRYPCDRRKCQNTPGSYRCLFECTPGYRWNSGNGECVDINECDEGRCGSRVCQNFVGSFTCLQQCVPGYRWKSFTRACVDRNECDGISPCSDNADCVNTAGSYGCTCKSGFKGNGKVCADIDECNGDNSCSANADCDNTVGSYNCTCKVGYHGNGSQCEDANECTEPDACSPNAVCMNVPGSYSCKCNVGFTGDGSNCTDVDECVEMDLCGLNANCDNVPGSYNCTCQTGFLGNGTNCTALPSITSPLIDSPVRLAGVIIGSLIGLMLVVFIIVIVILRRRKQNERLNKAEAEPRDRNIARSSNVQNQSYAEVRMSDLVGTELDDNMASVTQYSEDSQALYSNDLVKERKMKQRQMEQQERAFHNDAAVYENEPGPVGGVPTNGASAMSYDTLWKSGVTTSSDDTYNHLHQQTVVPEKKVETNHSVNVYNHLYGKGKASPKPVHGPTSVQDNLYSLANECNDSN